MSPGADKQTGRPDVALSLAIPENVSYVVSRSRAIRKSTVEMRRYYKCALFVSPVDLGHATLRLRRVAGFVINSSAPWLIRSVQRGEGQAANPFTISMLSLK